MPRVEPKPRSPAQLANDQRLRERAEAKRQSNLAPVVIRQMTESQEQQVGQDGVREFDKNNELPHTKVASPSEISGAIRKKGGARSQKWFDDMAFANEKVRVMVHEVNDKHANPFPEIWVNGRVQRFVRGEEQMVRRCYVEKLARLKLTTYGNLKTKDVDGEDVYRYPQHTGLLYPFVVIGDSEKGRLWLKQILSEA